MRKTFGLEQQRFHLPLHTRMGVVIALIIQLFDVFFREGQFQHLFLSWWFAGFSFSIVSGKSHFAPVASIAIFLIKKIALSVVFC